MSTDIVFSVLGFLSGAVIWPMYPFVVPLTAALLLAVFRPRRWRRWALAVTCGWIAGLVILLLQRSEVFEPLNTPAGLVQVAVLQAAANMVAAWCGASLRRQDWPVVACASVGVVAMSLMLAWGRSGPEELVLAVVVGVLLIASAGLRFAFRRSTGFVSGAATAGAFTTSLLFMEGSDYTNWAKLGAILPLILGAVFLITALGSALGAGVHHWRTWGRV